MIFLSILIFNQSDDALQILQVGEWSVIEGMACCYKFVLVQKSGFTSTTEMNPPLWPVTLEARISFGEFQ